MNERHEERIDSVLQALRNAEPAAGMEHRILARLRQVEPRRQAGPSTLPAWLPLPWPRYALAAAALVVAMGGFLYHHGPASEGASGSSARTQGKLSQQEAHTRPEPSAVQGTAGRLAGAFPEHLSAERQSRIRFVALTRSGAFKPHARSVDEEHSFPAPPLPLTEQELLLLRLVRQEPTVQLARLSRPVREAAFQRDKDEVTAFFTPQPLPIDPTMLPAQVAAPVGDNKN